MTSRERILVAMRNGQPDRVPVAPDISNMIPCRLTGKPFWEVYVNSNPPLWRAYLDAARYFDIDGWFIYGHLNYKHKSLVEIEKKIIGRSESDWEVSVIYHTPDGDLTERIMNPVSNPPTKVEKMVKAFENDYKRLRHLFSEITCYDDSIFKEQKRELGESGIMCVGVTPPGLHLYVEYFNGSLEAATYALYDYPELFEELRQMHDKMCIKQTEIAIDAGADSILTGGSGSITLQSPDIWRKLSLPTLKKITRMCREAGVISGIHSCGKERYLVEACANETDLDYINPLEISPMGDCDLAECKEKFGGRLALMGNLHTTDVMLLGTPEKVRLESLKAIAAAGEKGGFILSTGDQCGRDTPFENIFAMAKTVKEFGVYPLDYCRLQAEISRLEKVFL